MIVGNADDTVELDVCGSADDGVILDVFGNADDMIVLDDVVIVTVQVMLDAVGNAHDTTGNAGLCRTWCGWWNIWFSTEAVTKWSVIVATAVVAARRVGFEVRDAW